MKNVRNIKYGPKQLFGRPWWISQGVITHGPQVAQKRPCRLHFMPSVEPFKANSKENSKELKNPKTFFSVFELLIQMSYDIDFYMKKTSI